MPRVVTGSSRGSVAPGYLRRWAGGHRPGAVRWDGLLHEGAAEGKGLAAGAGGGGAGEQVHAEGGEDQDDVTSRLEQAGVRHARRGGRGEGDEQEQQGQVDEDEDRGEGGRQAQRGQ